MTQTRAYLPLPQKYRPQRFDQLVGQEAVASTLSSALRQNRIAPAYLFSGPRGTGKTSSARILARSLNCLSATGPTPEPCGSCELCRSITAGNALDVIEIDAASNTGVDNIRELIERSRFAPVQARWKVYVIDECHMLSTAAFNALLKTLEEPPPRVVFVLATTDPQRVLPTILSRCQRFDFRRIPLEALEGHLRFIASEEEIGITPEALHVVALRAQGGLRDAESLLDQLSLLSAPIEAAAVWELLGAVPEQELLELVAAMGEGDPLGLLETCRRLLERGREPGAVLQGLASLLRDLVLAGVAPDRLELTAVSVQLQPLLPEQARRIGKARLLNWQAQLKGSEQQLRQSAQPRLWLEVLLLGLLAEPAAAATAATVSATAAARPRAPAPAVPQPAEAPRAVEATVPAPAPVPVPIPVPVGSSASPAPGQEPQDLGELWQQILSSLELPSTRMLLSQQASLLRLDDQRAVVRVSSKWIAMVQSRLPLLETALDQALGSPRQVLLEASDQPSNPVVPPAGTARPVVARSSGAPPAVGPSMAAPVVRPPSPSPTPVALAPQPTAAPAAGDPAPDRPERQPLDVQARRLADFFNGEVVSLEE
ncbi:DNA polymerase III subunit gamma/tau [Synechococcus sp. CS-1329]|uniref:DNA polymerase III subunit gamma/tau n=1 Tax=Synechococcus sp. CS-1329 TaxID=2847975 RepID=UPI00223A91A9|nr:DNA polymerase III subunit gamma/tau [Synechococcus sp. CS-1329]MCT0218851.1 DNA polymerase III subunit gamma/tau [Synechococcus sp. CS-1329]